MTSSDIQRLILDLRNAILILRQRGVTVTSEQADERARNIVNGLIGNYDMRPLPGPYTVDCDPTPGKPIGHGWSCRCDRCADYHLKIKERV